MDASRLFGCKVSQLTKEITGIDYKSEPHHYVPKRQRETATAKRKTKPKPELPATKKQKQPSTSSVEPDDPIPSPDTLPTDSSSSELPKGL